jgi:hypothetical protein
MKAIKKQIKREYAIPTKDVEILTGKDSTKNIAKAYESVIITEDDGSQYCMERETFHKKYDIVDTKYAMSKANEIEFLYNNTGNPITFKASWGEDITAHPNAAIVIENGTFGYAIQAEEFQETYTVIDK